MLAFQHPEDQRFFEERLCQSGEDLAAYAHLFDFRPPEIKRVEFNRQMKAVRSALLERFGAVCQLKLLPDCDPKAGLAVDHVIPLSSNRLNKSFVKKAG